MCLKYSEFCSVTCKEKQKYRSILAQILTRVSKHVQCQDRISRSLREGSTSSDRTVTFVA